MKTPIEVADILKGDLIRKEFTQPDSFRVAIEYRASSDAHGIGGIGHHILLDRPTPSVELPTEPTLGWLTASLYAGDVFAETPNRRLAWWNVVDDEPELSVQFNGRSCGVARDWVTAFLPAVAVPKAALDRLRAIHDSPDYDTRAMARAAAKFLTAADEANA